MLELLSPAGSPEGVIAAVQNGAGAVYLGYGDFNARRNAKNFTQDQVAEAVTYCHARNTKVFVTVNTLLTQRELQKAQEFIAQTAQIGVDALIIQDLGVAQLATQIAPWLERHASTQMTVHSLDGAKQMADLGFSRVVLSRELNRDQIEHICTHSPIETEIFVHGAMCMSYSGQCFFSAVVGQRSGNRGLCAQPCRLEYQMEGGKKGNPLSLKDMSLAGHLAELSQMGLHCLKIEGRMKRAEYVAIVTKIYADALREGREPTKLEMEQLAQAFSRQGFTQGYYQDKVDRKMFGVRTNQPTPDELFAAARLTYEKGEHRQTPITAHITITKGEPITLTATTSEGATATATGTIAEEARTRAIDQDSVIKQISQTGGTPFVMDQVTVALGEGLSVPKSALNQVRRDVIDRLLAEKTKVTHPKLGQFLPSQDSEGHSKTIGFVVELSNWEQLTPALLSQSPKAIYLPLTLLTEESGTHEIKAIQAEDIPISVVLPRILADHEKEQLAPVLAHWKSLGVNRALAGTQDSLFWGKSNGFTMAGDYGLGVFNDQSLQMLKEQELTHATLSFELTFPQIRDLKKSIPTELFLYGRLPLMILQHCLTTNEFGTSGACHHKTQQTLIDRKGIAFPVVNAPFCRSEIQNSTPLYLAHKASDWSGLGVKYGRLFFTDEPPEQCAQLLKAYQTATTQTPEHYTTGLYYRGVE